MNPPRRGNGLSPSAATVLAQILSGALNPPGQSECGEVFPKDAPEQ